MDEFVATFQIFPVDPGPCKALRLLPPLGRIRKVGALEDLMQITPDDILDLINEAGQSLVLEVPNRSPIPIDTRFGVTPTKPSTNREMRGYLYSPKINQIPLTGTVAKSGEVIAIVFARGIAPEDFTPGCVLIGNGRRYRVALGMELRYRATLLAYELKLTPEQVPNASH